jgi:signal-transduction protein with cAMP-binding, CBS, and nucleotidyltransferase domain
MKGIEEIVGRLDHRVYSYKDVILEAGEPSNELLIIYHGEVTALNEDQEYVDPPIPENSIIGSEEVNI